MVVDLAPEACPNAVNLAAILRQLQEFPQIQHSWAPSFGGDFSAISSPFHGSRTPTKTHIPLPARPFACASY